MGELPVYIQSFRSMLQTRLQYRADFILSILGSLAFQLSPIATYAVVASQLPVLDGWSGPQVLFLFGLWAAALGLSELFADHVWAMPDMVVTGQFDRLLVYPVSTLPFFLVSNPQIHALGNLGTATLMLLYSGTALHYPWWVWPLLPFWALCGAIIYSSVLVLVSTLLILMPGKSMDLAWVVQQGSQATRFPLGVFPAVVKWTLLTVVPLGAYHYLPGLWLFQGGSAWAGLLAPPAMAALMAGLAWWAWEAALNHYESTGS
jgi:ABC-2 type transport system permease protein